MFTPAKVPAPIKNQLQVAAITGAVSTLTDMYGKAREYWRTHFAYTVVITDRDRLYDAVHAWLVEATPDERHRSLSVSTSALSTDDYDYAEPESEGSTEATEPTPLILRFNEHASRKVVLEGYSVMVSVKVPELSEGVQDRQMPPSKIFFEVRSYLAQQAVIRLLARLHAEQSTTRKATLKMVSQWGNWNTRSDLPPRTMDSVSLPKSQKERIMADLQTFLRSEEFYNRLAIPWHRGYMLYGPPGTGKTSLVKALANEFNLDLWYISIADLKAESSLLDLIGRVGPRSILLLEDIDTMQITHDRDNAEQGQMNTSSLLNALDGVATPHGLITVMTTNRFEILDPALTRAGRMDVVEKLDYPSRRILGDMFHHFYGEALTWPEGVDLDETLEGLSTSSISEQFKRHLTDAQGARTALYETLDMLKAVA